MKTILKKDFRTSSIEQKLKWMSIVRELDFISIDCDFLKNDIEFEEYLNLYSGNDFSLSTLSEQIKKDVLKSFRDFILRMSWKMGDLMPFNDALLENAPCLNPIYHDYDSWIFLAKQFQKHLPCKLSEFAKDLDQFDEDLEEIKENFSKFVKNDKTIVDFYLDPSLQLQYPYVTFVAGVVLALPPSSAEVERIFSRLNLTKLSKEQSF